MSFEQIRINLDRAKAVYQQALTSIDSSLRAIVSQDPATLAEARDVQASYGDGFTVAELAAAEQPEAPAQPEAQQPGVSGSTEDGKVKKARGPRAAKTAKKK